MSPITDYTYADPHFEFNHMVILILGQVWDNKMSSDSSILEIATVKQNW